MHCLSRSRGQYRPVTEFLSRIKEISPHAEPILVLSLTAILGLLLGSIKIRGMKLGVAGMLFSGLLLGHFGLSLDPHLMAFLKEFGLVLFVFTVGLQLGPGFFNSLKSDGLKLNSLAVIVVLLGAGIAYGTGYFLKWDIGVMAGTLSGATTNTPSLGAAQQAMAVDAPRQTQIDQAGRLLVRGNKAAVAFIPVGFAGHGRLGAQGQRLLGPCQGQIEALQ